MSFDLLSRTVTIADIAGESATQPPVSVKIASLTASGVSQPDAGRFSADSIEASDIEIGASIAGPAGGRLTYKVPRIVDEGLFRPRRPAAAGFVVHHRCVPVRARAVRRRLRVVGLGPQHYRDINFGAAMSGEFTYSGIAMQDIKGGKIATTEVERADFTVNTQQAGKPDKITGKFTNLVSHDFDATAAAAILDPKKANDDQYHRFYGRHGRALYRHFSAWPAHAHGRDDGR